MRTLFSTILVGLFSLTAFAADRAPASLKVYEDEPLQVQKQLKPVTRKLSMSVLEDEVRSNKNERRKPSQAEELEQQRQDDED